MATRSGLISARKATKQASVDQSAGAWTDITFDRVDLKGFGAGNITRPSAAEFQVSAAGTYLIQYFVSEDHADGAAMDLTLVTRAIINGTTVPDQSHANHGSHSSVGRNGHSNAFLVLLSANDIIKLQYRWNSGISAYVGTPLQDIGGTATVADVMTETGTGSPAGPAVTTFSMERVNEDLNPPLIALHKTASTGRTTAFQDVYWEAEDLRVRFATAAGGFTVTIPEDGVYLVGWQLSVEEILLSTEICTLMGRVVKNGSDIPVSNAHTAMHSAVGRPSVSHQFCAYFQIGDVLKLQHRSSAAADANLVVGGNISQYHEAVTSMFVLKVSDVGVIDDLPLNNLVEAATAGQAQKPVGWAETHTDATPVNWHVSSIKASTPGTKSIRYANQAANNFAGAGTNSGTMTTTTFSAPTGYTTYQLAVDVLADTESGTSYDLYAIEVWSTGLGLLTTILKASLGNGNTGNAFVTYTNTISASVAGRSDLYLKFTFNTVDGGVNTGQGVFFDNFVLKGS